MIEQHSPVFLLQPESRDQASAAENQLYPVQSHPVIESRLLEDQNLDLLRSSVSVLCNLFLYRKQSHQVSLDMMVKYTQEPLQQKHQPSQYKGNKMGLAQIGHLTIYHGISQKVLVKKWEHHIAENQKIGKVTHQYHWHPDTMNPSIEDILINKHERES